MPTILDSVYSVTDQFAHVEDRIASGGDDEGRSIRASAVVLALEEALDAEELRALAKSHNSHRRHLSDGHER